MKPSQFVKSGFFLTILNGVIAIASGQADMDLNSTGPFSKGNTFLNMSNKLAFQWKSLKVDGADDGNSNDYHLNVAGTWFVKENLGFGVGLYSSRGKESYDEIREISSSNVLGLNAIYGHPISAAISIYGRAEIRGGIDNYNYNDPQYPEKTKHSNLGFNLEVGAPVRLGLWNGFYFTPYVAYDYNVIKDDSYKDVYSGLNLGTRLNISLPCDGFAHGCSQVRDFSEGKYRTGISIIGGYSQIRLNLGGAKYFYNNEGSYEEYGKSSVSDGLIYGEYYRYLFDNVAVGGELRLRTSSEKDKETENKQSSISWMAKPTIIGNFPADGDLNNAFGFVGFGFGTASDKSTYFGNSTKTTETRTSIFFGAGYNVFFSESFSLVPRINYTLAGSKDSETDIKSSRNGFETAFSVRYSF